MAMDQIDAEIVAQVKRGLRSQAYLTELHHAFEENYSEAKREGDAVRTEMFAAALLLVQGKMGKAGNVQGREI